MQIDFRARNTSIPQSLREHAEHQFRKLDRLVDEKAQLELELMEERNPSISDAKVVEAALHLKPGTTLRAREGSPDFKHSIDVLADKLARQVKGHREKRLSMRRNQRVGKGAGAGTEGYLEA